MARISKRVASQHTQARLAKVVAQCGSNAQQPTPQVMANGWAQGIAAAPRVTVLALLRIIVGSGRCFDYGPVGLSMLRWIVINMTARHEQPDTVWQMAQDTVAAGPAAAPVAKPAQPAVAPVAPPPGATGAVGTPPVVAPVVAAPAPVAAPIPVIEVPSAPMGVPADVFTIPVDTRSPAEIAHPEWNWQSAAKVFGVKGLRGKVAVWPRCGEENAHPRVEPLDPDFQWDRERLQWAIFAMNEVPARGLWAWGNRASGKTSFAEQLSARTGRPFYGITFSRTMEPMEFLGGDVVENGGNKWRDGTLMLALRCKVPAIILLDEISLGQSGYISGPLNEIVRPVCSFTVPSTGERVNFNTGHLFIAADNTNGTGDTTGMYVDTRNVNRATMDRFAFFLRFEQMSKALETRLLMLRAKCDEALAEKVWGVMDALRKKVAAGTLSDPPSIREAIAFCAALRAGFSEKEAFEAAFVSKYAEESQESMRVTFTAVFNGTPEQA